MYFSLSCLTLSTPVISEMELKPFYYVRTEVIQLPMAYGTLL